eukprot:1914476-Pyramimonas_sp.AAC.1
MEIYRCITCYGISADSSSKLIVLLQILSGIVQGCPGSGALFAISADPFLQDMQLSVEGRKLGIVRARADDVGAAIRRLSALKIMARIFRVAARVASLKLKCSKCVVVPLASRFSPDIAN